MGKNKETWEMTLPVFKSERRLLNEELDFMTYMKDRSPDDKLDLILTEFFTSMSGESASSMDINFISTNKREK